MNQWHRATNLFEYLYCSAILADSLPSTPSDKHLPMTEMSTNGYAAIAMYFCKGRQNTRGISTVTYRDKAKALISLSAECLHHLHAGLSTICASHVAGPTPTHEEQRRQSGFVTWRTAAGNMSSEMLWGELIICCQACGYPPHTENWEACSFPPVSFSRCCKMLRINQHFALACLTR